MAVRQQYVDLDFQGVAKVINLPNPSGASDSATKAYVDANIEGQAWKDSTRVTSTANINLAAPGATIDGVTMVNGDRVLVKDQTTTTENGIYVWNGASTIMVRALDANTFAELEAAMVTVEEGATSPGTTWRQTAVNGVLGTDPVVWASFGVATPDASETVKGKLEIATQVETDTGTDDLRAVTPLKLATSKWAHKSFQQNVGDGVATQYDITHSLGSRDVGVEVYRSSGSFDSVECGVSRPDANTVRLNFVPAPTSNQFRVVISKDTNA